MESRYKKIQKSRVYLTHLVKTHQTIFNKSNPQLNEIIEHLEYAETLAKPLNDDGDMIVRIPKQQYEALLKQSEMFQLLVKAQADSHEINLIDL